MRILQGKAADRYVRSLERRGSQLATIEPAVRKIVEDVRQNGDRALLKHARRFDGFRPGMSLKVSESELREAWKAAPKQLRSALRLAE
ncbi:MAG TPA: histidinol dehydrogenase, partial [Terriglobales bacterium]|nr:histidinol dehydrogenase [Terriglobales bacterium]